MISIPEEKPELFLDNPSTNQAKDFPVFPLYGWEVSVFPAAAVGRVWNSLWTCRGETSLWKIQV